MASFTDDVQRFNPYVQQVPVDAYNRAELYRQGKYDAGVQAVQSYVDQTTGLDVDPKYKDYLQNSVNSLQDQVRKVGKADFSDMQLVNQIGGAASKIVGDSTVQAGIQSAANLKNQQTARAQAQKEGKSSVENDAYLDDQYAAWRQDPDLKNPFSGKYVQYTDLNKKWLEVVKSLHADDRLNDIPFETFQKPDGTVGVNYNKMSDVMMKLGISGLESSKIQNAISATMTPGDLQQLAISAKYAFRGYTPDDMVKASDSKYQSNVKDITSKLADAQKELPTLVGNTARSKYLNDIINDYKNQLDPVKGSLAMQHQNDVDAIKNDPDGAKTQLYKNGFMSEFSNAFSWKKDTTEYTKSPFKEQDNWNKDYQIKLHEQGRDDDKFKWEQSQDLIKNNFEYQKIMLEREKIYGKQSPDMITHLGASTDIPSATTAMSNDASNLGDQATQYRQAIKTSLGNKAMSDNDLDKKIDQYVKGDKTVFPANATTAVDQAIKATNDAKQIQQVIDKTRQEAEAEVYKTNPTTDDMLKDKKSLVVFHNGQRVVFSPREIYNYLDKETFHPGSQGSSMSGSGSSPAYSEVDDLNKLSEKEKILYSVKRSGDINVQSVINDISPVKAQTASNEAKVNALLDTKLATKNSSWVPSLEALDTPTEAARSNMESRATLLASRMSTDKGSNSGANLDDFNKWMGDSKQRANLKYEHFTQGGKEQLWVKNGDNVAKFNLTPTEAAQLPTANKVSPDVQNIQRKLDLGDGNTNTSGNPEDAAFRLTDFKSARKINVTADLQKETMGNNVYINLHIMTPSGWKTYQLPRPVDIKGAQAYIQGASEDQLITNAIQSVENTQDPSTARQMVAELQGLIKK